MMIVTCTGLWGMATGRMLDVAQGRMVCQRHCTSAMTTRGSGWSHHPSAQGRQVVTEGANCVIEEDLSSGCS